MKKNNDSDINIILAEFPADFVILVKEMIDGKNFKKKHNARISLVNMGKSIIPYLHKILSCNNDLLRLEVVKTAELIADRRSIPVFIGLLDDKDFDMRWIAAEGLIRIGRRSIVPLLKFIRDGESSYIMNKGAHHVLVKLLNERERELFRTLLFSLDDDRQLGETVPVEASLALKTFTKNKSGAG